MRKKQLISDETRNYGQQRKYRQYNTIQKKNQSKSKLAINRFGLQNKHETAK